MAYRNYLFLFVASLLLHVLPGMAAEVSPEKAQEAAARFLRQQTSSSQSKAAELPLQLVFVKKTARNAQARQSGKPLYYIFNRQQQGFVIVSGDDAAYPILAYSDAGGFDAASVPEAFQKWIAHYEHQIQRLIEKGAAPGKETTDAWNSLGNQRTAAVGPLLTSQWNQSPHFNAMCPYDEDAATRAVTGCVATAMAQIMKYHQHPARGTGFHSYEHNTYGTLSADFGLATYEWQRMPDVLNGPNDAVALLNYHCGVSVDMNYGASSSGAAGAVLVKPALQNYFQYEAEIASRENFTQAQWVSLLQQEIDAGRPMYYEGFGQGSGHAFVCDGYQDDEYFHFNWGWGGMMDGFYYINDLSPADLGTGGGNGSYNSHQSIVYNIKPIGGGGNGGGSVTEDFQLYSNITVDPDPVYFANPFTVNTQVVNWGDAADHVQLAAVITNQENITEVLDSVTIEHFESGYYYQLAFSSEGLPIATPGTYSIGIFYKLSGGDWKHVQSEYYTALQEVEVLGPDNPLELYHPIQLNADKITQHEPFEVYFNVYNNSMEEFSGTLYAALYDLDGYFQALVDSLPISSLPGGHYFVENLSMQSAGVDISPGSYLLALISGNASDTLLLASITGAINPAVVVVQAPPLAGDVYENNDSEDLAHMLELNENGDLLSVKTLGANQHNELDYDYYKIELPAGGNYEIRARVQDSYNSEDGQEYTNDVVFSYRLEGADWSDAFDTYTEGPIQTAGGTVTFWVSPYFAGQQGTYALDIEVSQGRTQKTLALSNPAKGASWQQGTTQEITWQSNFAGKVTLELYKGGEFVAAIGEGLDNTGSYSWQVPDTLAEGSNYQVLIYSEEDWQVSAESGMFTIDRITGIEDELMASVRFYPNPAQEQLSISFTTLQPEMLSLYSAQGVLLTRIPIQQKQLSIEMGHLPAGLYFMHCQWKEGQLTVQKILKQ